MKTTPDLFYMRFKHMRTCGITLLNTCSQPDVWARARSGPGQFGPGPIWARPIWAWAHLGRGPFGHWPIYMYIYIYIYIYVYKYIYMNILTLSVCMFESLHSPIAISWMKHLCMCVHHCRPVHGEHRYPGVFPCTKPHEQEWCTTLATPAHVSNSHDYTKSTQYLNHMAVD